MSLHLLISSLGYSPANTPHLTPALELDTAMIEFSASLEAKGLPTTVNSEKDIDVLMAAFEEHVKTLDFWQYYVLNVKSERESVKAALSQNTITEWEGVEQKTVVELAEILRTSGKVIGLGVPQKRFGTHVDGEVAAGLVKAAFVDLQDIDALADAWIRVVDVLNVPLYEAWQEDTRVAMENIRNRLRYIRLDEHGPKMGPITKEYVSLRDMMHHPLTRFVDCPLWRPTSRASKARSKRIQRRIRWQIMDGYGTPILCRTLRCHLRKRIFAVR